MCGPIENVRLLFFARGLFHLTHRNRICSFNKVIERFTMITHSYLYIRLSMFNVRLLLLENLVFSALKHECGCAVFAHSHIHGQCYFSTQYRIRCECICTLYTQNGDILCSKYNTYADANGDCLFFPLVPFYPIALYNELGNYFRTNTFSYTNTTYLHLFVNWMSLESPENPDYY